MSWKEKLYMFYVSSGQSGIDKEDFNISSSSTLYYKKIHARFLKTLRTNDRIVDLGCGYGLFLHFLSNKGYSNLAGAEISDEQLEIAEKIGTKHLIQKIDVCEFLEKETDSSIRLLFMKDILEHFDRDNIYGLLEKSYQKLNKGGLIIIHVPNATGIFGMSIRYGDLTHEIAFNSSSINQLLRAVGFNNISCHEDRPIIHGFFSFFRYVFWIMGTIPFRLLYLSETGKKNIILSQNMTVVAYK